MGDSLVVAGQIELLGLTVSDHPACPGAVFTLAPDFNLGLPAAVVERAVARLLDGERPVGDRAGNRNPVLPVAIRAPDRATLAAAAELLLSVTDQPEWELIWTRDGALPLVFDCYRADASTVDYSLIRDKQLVRTMTLGFSAAPYGRSDDLEIIQFPAPSAGFDQPADPVQIDGFTSVSSADSPGQWSASPLGAAGGRSARWSRDWHDRPLYDHTLGSAVDLTGLAKLSFWLGLGTGPDQYRVWHAGRVDYHVVLYDAAGTALSFGGFKRCYASGQAGKPKWNLITAALPASSRFDFTTVSRYSIRCWNRTDPWGLRVLQAEAYLSGLVANPGAHGIPAARGAIFHLPGITGTARAPLGLQFTAPVTTVQQYWTRTAAGSANFTPGFTGTVKAEAWGPSGGSGAGDGSFAGCGSGAGEYAREDALPVTSGVNVAVTVGAGGAAGTYPNGNGGNGSAATTIAGVGKTVTANAGKGGKGGGAHDTAGAAGGSGSANQVHHSGGKGGPVTSYGVGGSGGGSSGGTADAGYDGREGSGNTGGDGGWAVTGGAAGADGADLGHAGTAGAAPGGGAGGGDITHAGAAGAAGKARITYGVPQGVPMTTLIAHSPGPGAPDTYQPLIPVGGGGDAPDGREYMIPPPGPSNWLTGSQATFETGLAGWTAAGGGSIAQTTADAHTGNGSMELTASGGNQQAAFPTAGNTPTMGLPCAAGDLIYAAANLKAVSSGKPVNSGADFFDAGGVQVGSTLRGANVTDTTTGWVTPWAVLTAPAGAATCRVQLQVVGAAASEKHRADDVFFANLTAGDSGQVRYAGTYAVWLTASSWANTGTARDLTVTVKQYDRAGGRTSTAAVTRAGVVPSTDITNGLVPMGVITLPVRDIPKDQTCAYYTVSVTSGQSGDRFYDVLLLDTQGETVIVSAAGTGFMNVWVDEPAAGRAVGRILGSAGDRDEASSILGEPGTVISGPPVSVEPGRANWVLAYSLGGCPGMTGSYLPRWRNDRLA